MKNEELIMNNEKYNAVGADPVSAWRNSEKPNVNNVGAVWHVARKIKTQKGITLIALIITIIILLILAGVTISVVLGPNGLFTTTKNAGEAYKKAGLKEEIEAEILNIQSRKILEGKEFKREDLNELSKIGVEMESYGIPAEGEYKDYFFEIDEKYVVTILEKQKGVKPTIEGTTITDGIVVEGETVEIRVTAGISEGKIISIEATNGAILKEDANNTKTEKIFTVNKNGIYSFKVTADNGRTNVTTVTVDTIIEKPKIEIKNITDENYTVEVTNNYEEGLITEYKYYINNNLQNSGTINKTCIFTRTNDAVNIYIEAYVNDKSLKSETLILPAKLTSSLSSTGSNIWGNLPYGTKSAGQYIQYFCGRPEKIRKIQFEHGTGAMNYQLGRDYVEIVFNIQGSNDGINFEKITEDFTTQCFANNVSGTKTIVKELDMEKEYSYYRLVFVSGGLGGDTLAEDGKINYSIGDVYFFNEDNRIILQLRNLKKLLHLFMKCSNIF